MAKKNKKLFWEDEVKTGLESESDDNVMPKLKVSKQKFAIITSNKFAEKTIKVALDYQLCTKSECPIYNKCPYNCKTKTESIKCQFEVQIINQIYVDYMKGIGDMMTQGQMDVFGLTIMPLYIHLVRFQKWQTNITNMIYSDSKGVKRPHPVFKEIRETIKLLNSELRLSGLSNLWVQKFGKRTLPVGMTEEDRKFGDTGRYDEFDTQSEKETTDA